MGEEYRNLDVSEIAMRHTDINIAKRVSGLPGVKEAQDIYNKIAFSSILMEIWGVVSVGFIFFLATSVEDGEGLTLPHILALLSCTVAMVVIAYKSLKLKVIRQFILEIMLCNNNYNEYTKAEPKIDLCASKEGDKLEDIINDLKSKYLDAYSFLSKMKDGKPAYRFLFTIQTLSLIPFFAIVYLGFFIIAKSSPVDMSMDALSSLEVLSTLSTQAVLLLLAFKNLEGKAFNVPAVALFEDVERVIMEEIGDEE